MDKIQCPTCLQELDDDTPIEREQDFLDDEHPGAWIEVVNCPECGVVSLGYV